MKAASSSQHVVVAPPPAAAATCVGMFHVKSTQATASPIEILMTVHLHGYSYNSLEMNVFRVS
jgi:hypothetical protein